MKLNFSLIKKRPILMTTLVVVGGLVFYFLFLRGGSQQATAPAQMGYGDANVAAASGLAAAQMQANARAQEIQGQLAGLQIQASSEIAIAEAQANLQRDLAAFSYQAAQLDNARDLYALTVQEKVQMYGLETSADIEQLRISSELEALKVQAERDLNYQSILTQGQIALSNQAAAVSIAGITSQENIARYSLQTTEAINQMAAETQLGLALASADVQKTAYETQVALAKQQTEREKISANASVQNTQANVRGQVSQQKSKDKTSTILGLAGLALSFFCDRNIKSIHGCVSNERCLIAIEQMPVEVWRYLEGSEPHANGDTAYHINTYSQDFYRTLGASDWETRKKIDAVDYLGALTGAVKALAAKDKA